MVCLQVEVLREPFTVHAVYGLSQNVSELRAAALLAQSPKPVCSWYVPAPALPCNSYCQQFKT